MLYVFAVGIICFAFAGRSADTEVVVFETR